MSPRPHLTCFPHFQSGPRITRAPTPSIINLVVLLPAPAPPSIFKHTFAVYNHDFNRQCSTSTPRQFRHPSILTSASETGKPYSALDILTYYGIVSAYAIVRRLSCEP